MKLVQSDDIPAGIYQAVGMIAATWSYVEHQIQRAIAEIIGIEEWKGLFLLDNLGFHSRIFLLQTLANALEDEKPDTAAEFKCLIKALNDAYGIRNKYVHGYWMPAAEDKEHVAQLRTIRVRGRIRISDELVTLDDIVFDANDIKESARAFTEFLQDQGFLAEPQPTGQSPEQHP